MARRDALVHIGVILWSVGCGGRTGLAHSDHSTRDGGGSCSQGLVVLASGQKNPARIAVDKTYAYWTTMAGSVMKVPLCGGTPITLASLADSPYAIAVDSTSVYWTNVGGSGVTKVPLDGGTITTLASGQLDPWALALQDTNLYWASFTDMMKTPTDGGASTALTSIAAWNSEPPGIAADATNIYWTEYSDAAGNGAVLRVPVGGGGATVLASSPRAQAIALDATSVYWTIGNHNVAGSPVPKTGAVMKVSIAGGLPMVLASQQDIGLGGGIAVDAESVYWTSSGSGDGDGAVMKVPPTGGTPTTLASGQGAPLDIAVDDTSVYWVDGLGSIMKVTPK